MLGLIFSAKGITSDGVYALLAESLSGWLRGSARLWKAQSHAAGGVYLTLGVAALVSENRPSEPRP